MTDIAPGLPFETKSYVCLHVFERSRPVRFVYREDDYWCLLCGYDHEGEDYLVVVGLGHVVERDPSIVDVLDLNESEEAARNEVGGAWER